MGGAWRKLSKWAKSSSSFCFIFRRFILLSFSDIYSLPVSLAFTVFYGRLAHVCNGSLFTKSNVESMICHAWIFCSCFFIVVLYLSLFCIVPPSYRFIMLPVRCQFGEIKIDIILIQQIDDKDQRAFGRVQTSATTTLFRIITKITWILPIFPVSFTELYFSFTRWDT